MSMSESMDRTLRVLASELGVVVDWVDAWGHDRSVSTDNLLAVASAVLGESLASERDVAAALDEIARAPSVIEPVIVAWEGRLPDIEVRTPTVDAVVVLESGDEFPLVWNDGRLGGGDPLPVGYHQLVIDGGESISRVFAAPARAHKSPHGTLGLTSPTYALRSSTRDVGIGTLGELRTLSDLGHEGGIEVVGTLPLLAAFDDHPSPYSPASRRAWNELFIDRSRVPGWNGERISPPVDSLWVDYEATGRRLRSDLARYSEHVSRTPNLAARVAGYVRRNPEISRYADFRALVDVHGRNWRAWSGSIQPDPRRVNYHTTVQWVMDEQLSSLSSSMRERGQYLYLDLPVGCHPDGYDVWDSPGLFAEASLGAPPDTLFVGGQDWGLPATVPTVSRATGHENFRKAVAKQLSVAGLLRIDHVMGTHRTWWVPHGADARDGAYVLAPAQEMFAIIAIESARARSGVVGENLGTVPPEIRTSLDEHQLLGMVVTPDGSEEPGSEDLVAMTSHDTPSFVAWWKGSDIADLVDLAVFDEDRARSETAQRKELVERMCERFGTTSAGESRDAVMQWMMHSSAAIALINLDDVLMEERRQNVPGTDTERPNWRLRYAVTLEEIARSDRLVPYLQQLSATRQEHARNSHGNGVQ